MEKGEILKWSSKHDSEYASWIQKEKEIGDRLRVSKELTIADLIEIIKWKFEGLEGRKTRILNYVENIDEQILKLVSKLVFNLNTRQDIYKTKLLCTFDGIGPAIASTILTFFDPENYGVFDIHVWREIFGREKGNLFTAENYLKLLSKLREIADRYNLKVRTVEKAYFKKNYDRNKKSALRSSIASEQNKRKKEAGEEKEITKTELMRREFLKQLLEKSNKKTTLFSSISPPKPPSKDHWVSKGAGISGVLYQYVILKDAARVQLSIESEDRNKNKRIFDALYKNRDQIERDFGGHLIWDRLNERTSSRIKRIVENKGLNDKDIWSDIQDKMIGAMIRLEKALSQHVRELP